MSGLLDIITSPQWSPYAAVYPRLKNRILEFGSFRDKTLIDLLNLSNPWPAVIPVILLLTVFLYLIERAGL